MLDIQRQELDIEIYRGDAITETLTVLDVNDAVVDLTGCVVRGEIKRHVDGDTLITLDLEIDEPTTGVVLVNTSLDEVDYDFGPDGVGVWDLQVEMEGHRHTSHRGAVTYVEDVTQDVVVP